MESDHNLKKDVIQGEAVKQPNRHKVRLNLCVSRLDFKQKVLILKNLKVHISNFMFFSGQHCCDQSLLYYRNKPLLHHRI